MKVKAAVAVAPNKIEVLAVDLDEPRAGECLIEVCASGICHTDDLALSGDLAEVTFPVILGHEGAGVVRKVGAGVTAVEPGDHVILLHKHACGGCAFCLDGRTNLCLFGREQKKRGLMPDGTTRFSIAGKPVYHYMGISTFSSHTVVAEAAVARIRKDVPLHRVCCIGCAVATGLGAVLRAANVKSGASVAVFGLGGVGLNVVQGARLAGAGTIIGLDTNRDRQAMARRLGVTDFIAVSGDGRDVLESVYRIAKDGVDHSFECIGCTSVMRLALESCHFAWGRCTIVGLARKGQELSFPPDMLDGRCLRGTTFGEMHGRKDIPTIVDWYADGRLQIDPLITHELPIDDIGRGFELMRRGECLRCVIRH
ncbi:zinc-binding dehydrogenase [Bradyrhizobium sp. 21]|uniref:zinc-binding dehydrogenase n=1 Tax=Bradyrhizobium sp. 21 TaxID=2782666 RepID=UPI001FFA3261|nr:zinc-binding dehydrogenase [Bradyrhizobium sp. 21]MCK1387657.1 alcohol dehydrogenase catalytic domain-containing protein [Bradyrhizobium sp. 21]